MTGAGTVATVALALGLCTAACGPPPEPGPVASDIYLTPEATVTRLQVPDGGTLGALLRQHGLAADVTQGVIDAAKSTFDLRRLRARQWLEVEEGIDGRLRRLDYTIDNDRLLRVVESPDGGNLVASIHPIPKEREERSAHARIDAKQPSLFQAVQAAGERAELAMALADVFSGEVDFNSDLQRGDEFDVVFEHLVSAGGPSSYGDVLAAAMRNDGRQLVAYRFTPAGRSPAYYDEEGRSLRRFFLRSPLKFNPRITSGFRLRRMHPVLGFARPHLGVDFAAPTGSPVVAVAGGRVVSTTYDRTNGRMVHLRHASGYETYYLHLSAFAPGLRAGARVEQGELIGRVGSSGLATGSHLDYRVRQRGVFVNPLDVQRKMPPGEPLPQEDREAFELERDRLRQRLHQLDPQLSRS